MKKIVDYQVVEATSPQSLCLRVNEALKNGWQPYGGPVACVNVNGNKALAQAMVRYESDAGKKFSAGITSE